MSKKPYRSFAISRFRAARSLAWAASLALVARPLPGQALAAPAAVVSCAAPVVIDAASLPYASPAIDTRSLILAPTAAAPVFPCYAKLVAPSGGQVPPLRVVWFSFTPAETDTYRIDTLGSSPSDYDTIIATYVGSCGSLVPVSGVCGKSGFNPDDAPGSLQSSVTLTLTSGTTYTIAVGAIGSLNPYTGQVDAPAGGLLKLNVARVAVSYPYAYLLPSITHSGGFVSDLSVTNLEGADGQFLAQYLTHGNDGEQTMPAVQPVAPPQIVSANGTRLYPDVLGLLGYANDWGSIDPVVQPAPPRGRADVGARRGRRHDRTVHGRRGGFPGGRVEEALGTSETGRFVAVREDAGMRTNLVFANTSAVPCALRAEVRDAAGAVLGSTRTITVPPTTAVQKNRLKDTFGIASDVTSASIVVRNVTAGCSVVGVAYVLDGNATPGTNDPYAVPLRK